VKPARQQRLPPLVQRQLRLPRGTRKVGRDRRSRSRTECDNYYSTDEKNPLRGNRSAIKNAINEQLKAAGREGEVIAYQIVFQATKSKTDPRKKEAAAAAPAAAAPAQQASA
jgi:hypothetical protein